MTKREQIRAAWRFSTQYTRRDGRLVVEQVNEITGQRRTIDAATGRTLPRR
jgi:hypothetical protein